MPGPILPLSPLVSTVLGGGQKPKEKGKSRTDSGASGKGPQSAASPKKTVPLRTILRSESRATQAGAGEDIFSGLRIRGEASDSVNRAVRPLATSIVKSELSGGDFATTVETAIGIKMSDAMRSQLLKAVDVVQQGTTAKGKRETGIKRLEGVKPSGVDVAGQQAGTRDPGVEFNEQTGKWVDLRTGLDLAGGVKRRTEVKAKDDMILVALNEIYNDAQKKKGISPRELLYLRMLLNSLGDAWLSDFSGHRNEYELAMGKTLQRLGGRKQLQENPFRVNTATPSAVVMQLRVATMATMTHDDLNALAAIGDRQIPRTDKERFANVPSRYTLEKLMDVYGGPFGDPGVRKVLEEAWFDKKPLTGSQLRAMLLRRGSYQNVERIQRMMDAPLNAVSDPQSGEEHGAMPYERAMDWMQEETRAGSRSFSPADDEIAQIDPKTVEDTLVFVRETVPHGSDNYRVFYITKQYGLEHRGQVTELTATGRQRSGMSIDEFKRQYGSPTKEALVFAPDYTSLDAVFPSYVLYPSLQTMSDVTVGGFGSRTKWKNPAEVDVISGSELEDARVWSEEREGAGEYPLDLEPGQLRTLMEDIGEEMVNVERLLSQQQSLNDALSQRPDPESRVILQRNLREVERRLADIVNPRIHGGTAVSRHEALSGMAVAGRKRAEQRLEELFTPRQGIGLNQVIQMQAARDQAQARVVDLNQALSAIRTGREFVDPYSGARRVVPEWRRAELERQIHTELDLHRKRINGIDVVLRATAKQLGVSDAGVFAELQSMGESPMVIDVAKMQRRDILAGEHPSSEVPEGGPGKAISRRYGKLPKMQVEMDVRVDDPDRYDQATFDLAKQEVGTAVAKHVQRNPDVVKAWMNMKPSEVTTSVNRIMAQQGTGRYTSNRALQSAVDDVVKDFGTMVTDPSNKGVMEFYPGARTGGKADPEQTAEFARQLVDKLAMGTRIVTYPEGEASAGVGFDQDAVQALSRNAELANKVAKAIQTGNPIALNDFVKFVSESGKSLGPEMMDVVEQIKNAESGKKHGDIIPGYEIIRSGSQGEEKLYIGPTGTLPSQ